MAKVIITPNYAKMSVTLGLALPGPRGLTGAGLEFDWDDTSLGVRVEGQDDYQYRDLRGPKGETGAVPNLQVGTVQTLPAGSSATVTRRSGSPDTGPIFDFGIPKGFDGDGSDAGSITYDNSESGLEAETVQDAIDVHIADYLAHKADYVRIELSESAPSDPGTNTWWYEDLGETPDLGGGDGGLLLGNASIEEGDDVWFDEV